MANEFDLGLNIASIETELPDPVITLTGSDNLTAAETAEMPLLALTAYGRSWQNYASHGGTALGKNLFDFEAWKKQTGTTAFDGKGTIAYGDYTVTITSTSDNCLSSAVGAGNYKLKSSTQYTLSWDTDATEDVNAKVTVMFDNATVHYFSATASQKTLVFTTLADTVEVDIRLDVYKSGCSVTYSNMQLEEGGTATVYEPYYSNPNPDCPVPIESIGDSGSLTVTTCGNNLFDNDLLVSFVSEGRKIEKCDDGTLHFINTDGLYFMPTVKITLQKGVYSTIASRTTISGIAYVGINYSGNIVRLNSATPVDFTLSDTTDVEFSVTSFNTRDAAEFYFNISLVKKGTNTAYEPYQSATAKITTALPLRGLPVSNGGNYTDSNGQEWICDTLEHVYGEPAQVTRRIAVSSVSDVALDTLGMKSVIQFDANYINHPGTSYRWYRYYCDYIVVYESPSAAYGVFYECHGVRYGENCDLGPYVTESSSITGQWGRPEEFTFYGDIRVSDSLKSRVSIKPVVTLADGTTDPETYICETEKLTVGAEVIYPQKAETVLLTTKETNELNSLNGFAGSTTIYNDNTAEMTVKLLREDFEMQYIHWIKESQSFVCEKAGKYKIICVGGGSSGGIGAAGAAETMQAAGTTTSFGTIISAEGGGKSRALMPSAHLGSDALIGGQSGYDGINYGSTSHVMAYESSVNFSSSGSNSSVMWGTGHGYGAGGGARGYSDELVAAGGRCGKVESTIVDLEENQTVACTIGGGGVLVLSDANVLEYLKTYVGPEKTSATGEGEKVSACVSSGADGVIVIQYLGL